MWNAFEVSARTDGRLFTDTDYEIVRQAIGTLPAAQREAVHLRYWEGFSIEEIAKTSERTWEQVFEEMYESFAHLAKACMRDLRFSRNQATRD